MRRLVLLCSAMVFIDVAFFSAIAPLLPDYVDELGLSEAEAGILSASYAAGTLLAALPGGWVASRIGPRRTVIGGLLLLGVTSVVFGYARDIVLLDTARFVQGVAGALIWAGALTWLITTASEERRGQVIGTALGTAIAGALLGPALGAIAGALGTEVVFGSILAVTVVLAWIASRFPEVEVSEPQDLREVGATMVSRPVLNAALFVAVPSTMFGAIEVLVPLRIDDLGGGHAVIAGGFIAGAAIEATLAPLAGRYSDRVGRRLPFLSGLTICAVTMTAIGIAGSLAGVLAALLVTSVGAGFCFAPAMTMLSDAAAATDLHQGFAAGLSNMAWAIGQVVGGIGGGVVAELTGNALPSILISALLLATVLYAFKALAPRPSGELAPP
jgi:MFS family permease